MKTITLRTLVREPLKVKKITRTGNPVKVTDKGEALWVIHPAHVNAPDDPERRRAIDDVLDEVLAETPGEVSAATLLDQSRR